MKLLKTFSVALAILSTAGNAYAAADYTKGVVKKIDTAAKKVTINHEELKNLEMPAMTMVFRVADDAMLTSLKEGQNIEFIAERVDGKLTVTQVK